jgi:hypothetical protein
MVEEGSNIDLNFMIEDTNQSNSGGLDMSQPYNLKKSDQQEYPVYM